MANAVKSFFMIIESKTVFLIRIITWTNTQIGRTRKWESFIKEWYLEMMPQQALAKLCFYTNQFNHSKENSGSTMNHLLRRYLCEGCTRDI